VIRARSGLAAAIVLLTARAAAAQSFVQLVSTDACAEARSYERADVGSAALEARRACRLQRFEQKLATEREQQVAAQVQERDARVEAWLATTQPPRVVHPLALTAFAGTGVAAYGIGLSWMALRRLEAAASIGWRSVSPSDTPYNSYSGTAQYKSRTLGFTGRWFLSDRELSPFVGGGIGVTTANATVVWNGKDQGAVQAYEGDARGHSLSAAGGVQLAKGNFRLSVEYVFQYVFYTGASLADMTQTPNEQIRVVWQETLDAHRHGVRFEVGLAF
jgi:opacity protein-like surface antigen